MDNRIVINLIWFYCCIKYDEWYRSRSTRPCYNSIKITRRGNKYKPKPIMLNGAWRRYDLLVLSNLSWIRKKNQTSSVQIYNFTRNTPCAKILLQPWLAGEMTKQPQHCIILKQITPTLLHRPTLLISWHIVEKTKHVIKISPQLTCLRGTAVKVLLQIHE